MHSVMAHPVWWPGPQRLAFLIAVSDRVEGEDRAVSAAPTAGDCCVHHPMLALCTKSTDVPMPEHGNVCMLVAAVFR